MRCSSGSFRILPHLVACALALVLVWGGGAHAETLRLQWGSVNEWYPDGYAGVEDVALHDRQPDANFGSFYEWQSGATAEGGISRALIRWDLQALAPLFSSDRYEVVLAELKLGLWYNRDAEQQPFDVYRVTTANRGWIEGSAHGKLEAGAATWNAARSGDQAWAGEPGCGKPGVDYDADPVASFESDTATHMRPRYLNPVRLPVPMVRDWALSPEQNAGLLIKHVKEREAAGSVNFIPSEHTRSDYGWDRHHPELVITYVDRQSRGVSEPGELISDGLSDYVVVVPAGAQPSERRGADELVDHLRQMTGCRVPVLPEDVYKEGLGPLVSVGRTERSTSVLTDEELVELGDEGFVIRPHGKDLYILGGGRRGALYGVFEFLESLGIRWYTPSFSVMPNCADVSLPETDTRLVPKCFYRDQLWNNG
ncbi:MAG: hypothetical protein GY851_05000, partial [bacterium]|nr:hypothetical protein [bacterium]